jgi:hypothetical protein
VNTTAGTDPVNDCTASACTNTGNCNGAGACQVPSAGTDPNNFCPNATCMDVNCNGAGACQFVANGVQGQNCTAAASLCSNADTCNGAGTCLANTVPAATYGPGCNVGTHGGCAACNGAEGGCQWYSLCGNWGSCSGGLHCTSTGACIADTGGSCD